jgi:nucleoside-diphosphate-sugar epimerase
VTTRRIAVTGATGFIGGAIVQDLARTGHRIRVLVRPKSIGKTKYLPNSVEVIEGDLSEQTNISDLIGGVDTIIHCAGAVRGGTESAFMRINEDAVRSLVNGAARESTLTRFLLVSSLAASSPEVSPYAASKRAGEDVLNAMNSRTTATIFRPPAVYGPGDTELLPLFKAMSRGFAPIWGVAEQRFSLIYINDFVAAVSCWVADPNPPAGIYELHDGRPDGYSMPDVVALAEDVLQRRIRSIPIPAVVMNSLAQSNLKLARLLGYEPMLTPWKLRELRHPRWVCDNGAITRAFGWQPQVELADGLPRALSAP